ncbi:hypothetical protein F442_00354 [Phytophthora nicotianae P10297]|uniref:Uncharacterized protein n=1 Tax=Phytophthora nicotianae P10297 TaxID=1317064 RepID=W3A920_PHYNI|nr:hypothetical protein F442_00354 [Phytophthora nicotianae P10297]
MSSALMQSFTKFYTKISDRHELMIILSYAGDYDIYLQGFWDHLWRNDEWAAHVLNEFRMVVVVSWSDLASPTIFFIWINPHNNKYEGTTAATITSNKPNPRIIKTDYGQRPNQGSKTKHSSPHPVKPLVKAKNACHGR